MQEHTQRESKIWLRKIQSNDHFTRIFKSASILFSGRLMAATVTHTQRTGIKIKKSILSYSQDKASDHRILQIMGCVLILAQSDESLLYFQQKQPEPLIM